jgi:hypothetical protein
MNKAEEKAEELHDKFFCEVLGADTIENIMESKNVAKQCALICVDEMLIIERKYINYAEVSFLNEVKSKIEGL